MSWHSRTSDQIMKCPQSPKSCTVPTFLGHHLKPRGQTSSAQVIGRHLSVVQHLIADPTHPFYPCQGSISLSPAQVLRATSSGKAKCPRWLPPFTNQLKQPFYISTTFCLVFTQLQLIPKMTSWNTVQSADLQKWTATKVVSFLRHKMIKGLVYTDLQGMRSPTHPLIPFFPSPTSWLSRKGKVMDRNWSTWMRGGKRAWLHSFQGGGSLWVPSTPPGGWQTGAPFMFWFSPPLQCQPSPGDLYIFNLSR